MKKIIYEIMRTDAKKEALYIISNIMQCLEIMGDYNEKERQNLLDAIYRDIQTLKKYISE